MGRISTSLCSSSCLRKFSGSEGTESEPECSLSKVRFWVFGREFI